MPEPALRHLHNTLFPRLEKLAQDLVDRGAIALARTVKTHNGIALTVELAGASSGRHQSFAFAWQALPDNDPGAPGIVAGSAVPGRHPSLVTAAPDLHLGPPDASTQWLSNTLHDLLSQTASDPD